VREKYFSRIPFTLSTPLTAMASFLQNAFNKVKSYLSADELEQAPSVPTGAELDRQFKIKAP
jgi:hypothetical protein